MNLSFRFISLVAALLVATSISTAKAAFVTGPWTNAVGQGDGPITNSNTASPTVGDGTANSADGEMFDSAFPAITLANAGDKIIFTGSVTLQGTVNSAASSGTPRTQFRFGLFGDDGDGDDLEWVGYYMSNKHGNAGTPAGTLARKPVGNTSVYLSATGQNSLASVQGDGTAASLFNDDTYDLSMIIERNVLGELQIMSSITGSNGFSQTLNTTDTSAATAGTYTFDRLGFLLGGNLDTDQAVFSNLRVRIPEPASWSLAIVSLIVGLIARCGRS
jgi:hypothetical protein